MVMLSRIVYTNKHPRKCLSMQGWRQEFSDTGAESPDAGTTDVNNLHEHNMNAN